MRGGAGDHPASLSIPLVTRASAERPTAHHKMDIRTGAFHSRTLMSSPRLDNSGVSFRRVQAILSWTAIVLTAAVMGDIGLYVLEGNAIRGVDYAVLAGGAGFLICCLVSRPLARKLSLSLLTMLVCLCAMESVLGGMSLAQARHWPWYVWPPGYSCRTHTRGLPGVPPSNTFTTNSRGIRGPEFSEADRYRVLCVGGSTTECFYLDDSKAWPHVLGRTLASRIDGLWVGNVGRSGLTALDHATLLEHLPESSEVDCWIVLCGVNDAGLQLSGNYQREAERTFQRTFVYRRPGLIGPLRRPFHRNLCASDWLESMRGRIQVALSNDSFSVYQDTQAIWVDQQRRQRRNAKKTDALPPLAPLLDEYELQLMRIVRLSREKRVRLILLTQPTLWQENMPGELESLTYGGQTPDGDYLSNDARVKAMKAYNALMRTVCLREEIECVDLAAELPKTTEVFYDDVHFNERGARRVAQRVAQQLGKPALVNARNISRSRRTASGMRPKPTDDRRTVGKNADAT